MQADTGRDATGRRILPMTFSASGERLEDGCGCVSELETVGAWSASFDS